MTDITDLCRPIIGIENRTAQEAFDIMADRIRAALSRPIDPKAEVVAWTDEIELANVKAKGTGLIWDEKAANQIATEPKIPLYRSASPPLSRRWAWGMATTHST